jgi:hypothetical protein
MASTSARGTLASRRIEDVGQARAEWLVRPEKRLRRARTHERGVILVKRLIMVVIAAVAAVAATVNMAVAADPPAPAPTVVCLNNATASLAVDVPYVGGSALLDDTTFGDIEANEANGPGGLFYAGVFEGPAFYLPDFIGDTPEEFFDPGYTTNHVTRGACFVVQERNYPTCYANFPDSIRYVGGDEARAMLEAGTFRAPLASTSQVTSVKVGTHYLTCNAGSQKPTGKFVSTGNGGEVVSVDSVGAGLLRSNPLDYTMEVS